MDITQVFSSIGKMLSGNPLAAGAFSVWALGLMTYVLRSAPSKLWVFIKTRFVVSLALRAGLPMDIVTSVLAQSFYQWYMASTYSGKSRRFMLEANAFERGYNKPIKGTVVLGPGSGIHFFMYGKHLAWFTRDGAKSSSGDNIEINFIGTDKKIITDFITEISYKPTDDSILIYMPSSRVSGSEWEVMKSKKKRPLESVIINAELKSAIVGQIQEFKDSKQWYEDKGINHKLTYMLYGEPGTGKSSLIFALASHFNRNIYMFNMNTIRDATFQKTLDNVPVGSFIVFEDIDVSAATKTRSDNGLLDDDFDHDDVHDIVDTNEGKETKRSPVSMSTILNGLDGIGSFSDNVMFITTNHLDKLDPALVRKGRIDHTYELKHLAAAEVQAYIQMATAGDNYAIPDLDFADIAGCDLQALYLNNRNDIDAFVESIPLKLTAA